jgi:hypothetical protein
MAEEPGAVRIERAVDVEEQQRSVAQVAQVAHGMGLPMGVTVEVMSVMADG